MIIDYHPVGEQPDEQEGRLRRTATGPLAATLPWRPISWSVGNSTVTVASVPMPFSAASAAGAQDATSCGAREPPRTDSLLRPLCPCCAVDYSPGLSVQPSGGPTHGARATSRNARYQRRTHAAPQKPARKVRRGRAGHVRQTVGVPVCLGSPCSMTRSWRCSVCCPTMSRSAAPARGLRCETVRRIPVRAGVYPVVDRPRRPRKFLWQNRDLRTGMDVSPGRRYASDHSGETKVPRDCTDRLQ